MEIRVIVTHVPESEDRVPRTIPSTLSLSLSLRFLIKSQASMETQKMGLSTRAVQYRKEILRQRIMD